LQDYVIVHIYVVHITADGGDKSSHDLRAMAQEERIRAGEEQRSVFGGFEKYTKVSSM